MNSLELFQTFVTEALDYHGIYISKIYFQVFPGREGAGIDLFKSDNESIYMLFGEDNPPDYQLLIRLSWHEVAHLIDKLEGWPNIDDQEIIEKGIEEIMDFFPGKLAYGNCYNLIKGLENVISDISVIKRIISTPGKNPSLISMIKLLQNDHYLQNLTKPERLRRIIAIAMEMQYLKTTPKDKISKQFEKLENIQLEKIYKLDPEFKKTYSKILNIFKQIHFTTNESDKMQWIIESCKTIPGELVLELSQVYENSRFI